MFTNLGVPAQPLPVTHTGTPSKIKEQVHTFSYKPSEMLKKGGVKAIVTFLSHTFFTVTILKSELEM